MNRLIVFIAALFGAFVITLHWYERNVSTLHAIRHEGQAVMASLIFPKKDNPPHKIHYTEHLAWLNAVGGERAADRHSNAWTSNVAVGYWLSAAPEDLTELLKTLSGVFDPLDLSPEFADEERGIILREYEYRMANNTDAQASEAMNEFLYTGNSIAQSVIGTPDEIMALTYNEARKLHAATHVPANAKLVVTGDVSKRQVRRAMQEAGWPEVDGKHADISPPPFDLASPDTETLSFVVPEAAPRMIWRRVVALPDPIQFDLLEAQTALLRDILDTNLPGGLGQPLRMDAAIARAFQVDIWPVDDYNIEISFSAAPDADVTLTELQTAFERVFSTVASTGVPSETYSRVLGRFDNFWPDWSDKDQTSRWMADYVLDRVSNLREPLSERQLKRLHRSLSITSTNALLHQLAGEGRTAIAFIGPEETFK